ADGSFKATLSTSALAVGVHHLTATYSGDDDFSGSTSGHSGKVALLGSPVEPNWPDDVRDKIASTGLFVSSSIDTYDIRYAPPSLATLEAYDAVLVYPDQGYDDADALGDILAAYVNAGHGVVEAVFATASEPLGGKWADDLYGAIATDG